MSVKVGERGWKNNSDLHFLVCNSPTTPSGDPRMIAIYLEKRSVSFEYVF